MSPTLVLGSYPSGMERHRATSAIICRDVPLEGIQENGNNNISFALECLHKYWNFGDFLFCLFQRKLFFWLFFATHALLNSGMREPRHVGCLFSVGMAQE